MKSFLGCTKPSAEQHVGCRLDIAVQVLAGYICEAAHVFIVSILECFQTEAIVNFVYSIVHLCLANNAYFKGIFHQVDIVHFCCSCPYATVALCLVLFVENFVILTARTWDLFAEVFPLVLKEAK